MSPSNTSLSDHLDVNLPVFPNPNSLANLLATVPASVEICISVHIASHAN